MGCRPLLLLLGGASLVTLGESVIGLRRLHSDLLGGYDRSVRPVLNESDSVHLALGVTVIDYTLDSKTDVLESLMWLRMKWQDKYLRWTPSEYDNIKITRFAPSSIWTPDICLYSSWDRTCEALQNAKTSVIVSSSGSVLWVPPVRLSSRCSLDRTNWPRDQATCEMKFGSWTLNGNMLNMSLYSKDTPDTLELRPNLAWEVTNFTGQLERKYYECCDEPYMHILISLQMRRNEQRAAQVVMPIVCSAVLMLLAFLVPVTSPQKLTLCCVSVLISVIGMLNLFYHLPTDAHGTAAVGTFHVTFAVLLLIFTALEVAVVRVSRPSGRPLPRCLRGFLSGPLGKLLCLDTPIFHDYTPEDNEMLDSSSNGEFQKSARDSGTTHEWAVLAAALDRIFALVFVLIVAVVVPPNLALAP